MTRNAHLRGIGGPGAPHVFSFDRRADLEKEGAGPCCEISMLMNRLLLYSCHLSNTCLNELCILQGIDMSGCVSAFWRRLLPTLKPHDDDVILRPGHHSLEISSVMCGLHLTSWLILSSCQDQATYERPWLARQTHSLFTSWSLSSYERQWTSAGRFLIMHLISLQLFLFLSQLDFKWIWFSLIHWQW